MPILWMIECVIHDIIHEFYLEMGKHDPTVDQLTVTVRGVTVTMSADAIAEFLHIPRSAFPIEGDAPLPPPPKGDAHLPPVPEAHAIAGEGEPTMDHILLSIIGHPGQYHRGGVVIRQKALIPFFKWFSRLKSPRLDGDLKTINN
ncbi:hypothetical protein CJ030_MR2G008661 [Morella rubra]|uniref:Uncharacterized protein n=1 Tax=Morella rubra TaxID=262757 RepID=A0A6A1W9J4_9ROSI|nr:hypothetical protein CJ030_MR2G008661 [Morella rubra]